MSSYQEQLNFKREKLLLRLKQTDNIKKEILKHINKNNKQFMNFMENIIYLEHNDDLHDLEKQYKNLDIIVVYSTQSIINKVFAFLLGHGNAHNNTLSVPKKERKLLLKQCCLIKEINYFNLFIIMKLKFK